MVWWNQSVRIRKKQRCYTALGFLRGREGFPGPNWPGEMQTQGQKLEVREVWLGWVKWDLVWVTLIIPSLERGRFLSPFGFMVNSVLGPEVYSEGIPGGDIGLFLTATGFQLIFVEWGSSCLQTNLQKNEAYTLYISFPGTLKPIQPKIYLFFASFPACYLKPIWSSRVHDSCLDASPCRTKAAVYSLRFTGPIAQIDLVLPHTHVHSFCLPYLGSALCMQGAPYSSRPRKRETFYICIHFTANLLTHGQVGPCYSFLSNCVCVTGAQLDFGWPVV